MPRTERSGGPRPVGVRDWPYGAVGRRLLLETLLLEPQPPNGWTKAELECRAGTKTGGIDTLLAGALRWQLVERGDNGRWHRADEPPEIASPLEELLKLTRTAKDEQIPPLPKRAYRPR